MSTELTGISTSCFFCNLEEPDSSVRRKEIKNYFRNMHQVDDQELILVLSGLWNIAMTEDEQGELPSLGLFECMASLINKGVNDGEWLLRNQNIYIPYYAAHIVGSYTMNNIDFAVKAVEAGIVPPLLDLLRGKMSWVEQRVAVRALGHLASYERTFKAIATYDEEVVKLAVHLASTCVETVYNMFVGVKDKSKRLKYHCELMTRGTGLGDMETENRKAEEWASQLQCWCLNLLNCFAIKGMSLHLICKPAFMQELCEMWGGIANCTSPSGIGLVRLLCHSKVGRRCIAETENLIANLCNLTRSSDDWQYMGIDCLLLLLKDPDARYKVMEAAISCLIDLIELKNLGGRANVGETITRTLIDLRLWYSEIIKSTEVERALEEVRNFITKRRNEKALSVEKMEEQRVLVALIKQQGNHCFSFGRLQEAIDKYSEALELCPLRLKKERIVLHSNRAHCYLLQKEPDAAISDTTKALSLSSPANSHLKSLWRRSQAYDMKGLARESLMDCVMFINGGIRSKAKKQVKVPCDAVRMISKQMDSTWIFKAAQSKMLKSKFADTTTAIPQFDDDRFYLEKLPNLRIGTRNKGLPTISEEPLPGNWKGKRN